MRRRNLLTAAASLSVQGRFAARAAGTDTLRFIPQADVTILDPLTTTAYPTRNHGHMCWDTLYGLDANFVPSPQLASGHVVEDDGKRWTFTLRDGTKFHDGEPILARDAAASIRRWLPKDAHGQMVSQRRDEIRALDDRRLRLRLSRPFGPFLDALAKPWSNPCFIYPERFAVVDPATPLTEVVGSGPHRFVAQERVSGVRVVYLKFDGYTPTPARIPRSSWVGQESIVLDVLVQRRRNKKAAKRLLRKHLKKQGRAPRVLITDKLRSYGAAKREIMPGVEHRQHEGLNNWAENSDQPTRRRERVMKRFKSPRQVQRFLSTHDQIANVFTRRPNQDTAAKFRAARGQAFATWAKVTRAAMVA